MYYKYAIKRSGRTFYRFLTFYSREECLAKYCTLMLKGLYLYFLFSKSPSASCYNHFASIKRKKIKKQYFPREQSKYAQ
jgi:hypothetical protein